MEGLTLSDLEDHFCCLKLSNFNTSGNMVYTVYTMCLRINKNVHVAYNFNCLFESVGLLKVASNHLHCKCGNIRSSARQRHCYYRPLIGSDMWPSE